MRALFTFSVFLTLSWAPAFAGEERVAAGLESLSRRAEKVVLGRIRDVQRLDAPVRGVKLIELEVIESWKGSTPGERVRVLAFESVAHSPDPDRAGAESLQLLYLSKAPSTPAFEGFGKDLYLPAGGETSLLALDGSDASEILDGARAYLHGAPASNLLFAHLDSSSERLRESALASLLARPAAELRSHASRLATRLSLEPRGVAQAGLLTALAKAAAPEAIDPVIEFALDHVGGEALLPLAAEALNQIDATVSARRIEAKMASSPLSQRALSLLGRLDSPEGLRVLLERARRDRNPSAALALTMDPATDNFPALLTRGSLEEKKAAAYRMLRWGNLSERRMVRETLQSTQDPALRRFLERLFREPYLRFAELSQ